MEVLLTADDYGLTPDVNASIELLAEQGRISAASVMAHRDADLRSLNRLVDAGIPIGLHVCFTGVRPFVRELEGSTGMLPANYPRLFAAIARRPSLLPLFRAEADAQAERLTRAGVAVAFVNAHEHVHLFPPLWPMFAKLAQNLGARGVRSALGQRVSASAAGALVAASHLSWATFPLQKAVVLSPLGVGLAGKLTIETVDALLARPFTQAANRIRELCFHPALDTSERRGEHDLLASGAIEEILARRSLRKASAFPG